MVRNAGILIVCVAFTAAASAFEPEPKRFALLVGVNKYEHGKLPALEFAEADARDLAKLLDAYGWETILLSGEVRDPSKRPTKQNIERELVELLGRCRKGDTVLLAFAGHGLQFEKLQPTDEDEDAYFCPSDAKPFRDRTETLVSLRAVYKQMRQSFAGMKVLLVDACRNDPDAARGARSGVDADNAPLPPQGVAALFSCRAGERSFESAQAGGGHGVFFHLVLEGLGGKARDSKGRVTFGVLSSYVSLGVSSKVQELFGPTFHQSPATQARYSSEPVLATFNVDGPGLDQNRKMGGLSKNASRDDGSFGGAAAGQAMTNEIGMRFRWCPPGGFTMGSPLTDEDRIALMEDQVEVTLSRGFWLEETEVTQTQWKTFMQSVPWKGREYYKEGDEYPASYVTIDQAKAFCAKLTARAQKSGKMPKSYEYRLPTEAEWEYGCRAGSTTRFSFGDDETEMSKYAWWQKNASEVGEPYPHPVGQKIPNPWGLCDMHGNVAEFCSDFYSNDSKLPGGEDPTGPKGGFGLNMLRGGGWNGSGKYCRSAYREIGGGGSIGPGFRVCCGRVIK